MKAKEYFQTYFSEVPTTVTSEEFLAATSECLSALIKEQKQALESVTQINSKMAKIREFRKKWQAIGGFINEKYKNDKEGLVQPINEKKYIDSHDVLTAINAFDLIIEELNPGFLDNLKKPITGRT